MAKKKKYLTLVFKYIQDDTNEDRSMGVTKFLVNLVSAIKKYQEMKTSYEPTFDFYGAYVDEEDVPVEEQNDLNDNLKQRLK